MGGSENRSPAYRRLDVLSVLPSFTMGRDRQANLISTLT